MFFILLISCLGFAGDGSKQCFTSVTQRAGLARELLRSKEQEPNRIRAAYIELVESYITTLGYHMSEGSNPFVPPREVDDSEAPKRPPSPNEIRAPRLLEVENQFAPLEQFISQMDPGKTAIARIVGTDRFQIVPILRTKNPLNELAVELAKSHPPISLEYSGLMEVKFRLGVEKRAPFLMRDKILFVPLEVFLDVGGPENLAFTFVNEITSAIDSSTHDPLSNIGTYLYNQRAREEINQRKTERSSALIAAPTPKQRPGYKGKLDPDSKDPFRNPTEVEGAVLEAYKYFGLDPTATYSQIMDRYQLRWVQLEHKAILKNSILNEDYTKGLAELKRHYHILIAL